MIIFEVKLNIRQVCIPVGCVPAARCPYRGGVCTWSRGRVYLVWGEGGVPGPGGCTWSGGVYLVGGYLVWGVYLVWGGYLIQGVYLVWGGVPGPGAYLVWGGVPGPGEYLADTPPGPDQVHPLTPWTDRRL